MAQSNDRHYRWGALKNNIFSYYTTALQNHICHNVYDKKMDTKYYHKIVVDAILTVSKIIEECIIHFKKGMAADGYSEVHVNNYLLLREKLFTTYAIPGCTSATIKELKKNNPDFTSWWKKLEENQRVRGLTYHFHSVTQQNGTTKKILRI